MRKSICRFSIPKTVCFVPALYLVRTNKICENRLNQPLFTQKLVLSIVEFPDHYHSKHRRGIWLTYILNLTIHYQGHNVQCHKRRISFAIQCIERMPNITNMKRLINEAFPKLIDSCCLSTGIWTINVTGNKQNMIGLWERGIIE